ncbi:hypothetical protein CsSME_00047149 [Camellia sinensis var. sinensis]
MIGQLILQGKERRLSFPMGSLGWYSSQCISFHFGSSTTNLPLCSRSKKGMIFLNVLQGTMKLNRLAKALAAGVNVKRRAKGLLPRPVSFSQSFILMHLTLGYNCFQR